MKLPSDKFPQAESDSASLSEKSVVSKEKSIQLTSEEELYAQLRDSNFSSVGSRLSEKAKQISGILEQRHDAKTPQKMKQFVQNLPQVQLARTSLETRKFTYILLQKSKVKLCIILSVC